MTELAFWVAEKVIERLGSLAYQEISLALESLEIWNCGKIDLVEGEDYPNLRDLKIYDCRRG